MILHGICLAVHVAYDESAKTLAISSTINPDLEAEGISDIGSNDPAKGDWFDMRPAERLKFFAPVTESSGRRVSPN